MPPKHAAMVLLFDAEPTQIEPGNMQVLTNGDVVKVIRLAEIGIDWINGPNKFSFTKEILNQAIHNHGARGFFPIPITKGHYHDLRERQKQPAVAWIERMYIVGDEFLGKVRFLAKTWLEIVAGEWKGLSLEFFFEDQDQHGNNIGFNIDGAAILNYPFFPLRIDAGKEGTRPLTLYTLSRFAPTQEIKPMPAHTIQQVGDQFCVFDSAGVNLGCRPTMEEAQALLLELGGEPPPLPPPPTPTPGLPLVRLQDIAPIVPGAPPVPGHEIRQVGEEFCVFDPAGANLGCRPTMEEAKAFLLEFAAAPTGVGRRRPPPGAAGRYPVPRMTGGHISLTREQYQYLVARAEEGDRSSGELAVLRTKQAQLERDLNRLHRGRNADLIRANVRRLQHDHGVIVPLGDYAIESSDDDALAWLATAPFGITTIEGLKKLVTEEGMTAHLPRINPIQERPGGSDRQGTAPDDVSSEAGRRVALNRRVASLRRDIPKDELDPMLVRRKETIEVYAAKELEADYAGVKFQDLVKKS